MLFCWVVLNGRLDADVWISGLPLCLLLWLGLIRFTPLTLKKEGKLLRILPSLFLYFLLLFREIIKANLLVLKVVWHKKAPHSSYVTFHSGLQTQKANALLANSITLTPGTITVLQEGDLFTVHCLEKVYGTDMEHSAFVKALKKTEALWKQ